MNIKKYLPSLPLTSLISSLGCFGLLIFAWYLQTIIGIDPCPLCIIQRILFLIIGCLYLIGAIYTSPHPRSQRWFYSSILFFCLLGIATAARQLYIQHLPPLPADSGCGADLSFILQNMPLLNVIPFLLAGSASCQEVKWTLLGFSIPFWTLLSYFGLMSVSIWQTYRKQIK